jgi:hypothetical protein
MDQSKYPLGGWGGGQTMRRWQTPSWWMMAVAALLCSSVSAYSGDSGWLQTDRTTPTKPVDVPLERISPRVRDGVRRVLLHPTLASCGPTEVFRGRPDAYQWLLDHPDRAVLIWRRLGATCMSINDKGGGRFGWTDEAGSEVHWDTVYRDDQLRVWFAEGNIRPAPFLPTVAVRAVVVMRYWDMMDKMSRPLIRHQADLYVQTDSKTAILVTRLLGASAPRMAQQCIAQLEIFFSALVWYLDRHPERAADLMSPLPKPN